MMKLQLDMSDNETENDKSKDTIPTTTRPVLVSDSRHVKPKSKSKSKSRYTL